MKKISFMDLKVENKKERQKLLQAIGKVLDHGKILYGPEVLKFENEIAKLSKRKYALGVGSGSSALLLSLKALNIGPDDEVITTPLSWIATANAIALTGARVVFADIKEDLNIDPNSIEKLITKKTKAILPVHFAGRICQMDILCDIAKKNNLFVVEDAAQAFGAYYKNRISGSFGDVGCFSMNPMKILRACGEAGVIVTDSDEIASRIKILRHTGTVDRIGHELSLNHRLDTLQAAILLKRLPKVKALIKKKRQIALWYSKRLQNVVIVPKENQDEYNVYYNYCILVDKREKLIEHLLSKNIEIANQYLNLMPHQAVFKKYNYDGFPNAKVFSKKLLCLPMNEKLTKQDIGFICNEIISFYKNF